MAGKCNVRLFVYGCRPYDEQADFEKIKAETGMDIQWTEESASMDNAELAKGFDAISIVSSPMPAELIQKLSSLGVKMISTRSIGYDHIDLEAARNVGMRVSNTPYSPDTVAEFTVMAMLMALRQMKRTMQRAELHDFSLNGLLGRHLSSCTVGILGAGQIGARVAELLQGFGCEILVCSRHPKELPGTEFVSLEELLRRSDVLTLHMPLNSDNFHLLNREAFSKMKDGAILVNTARGGLVDTEALIEALEQGKLSGAALDVIEGEKGLYHYDKKNEQIAHRQLSVLKDMPNVIFSAHTAFYTREGVTETSERSVLSCVLELTGKENPWRIL